MNNTEAVLLTKCLGWGVYSWWTTPSQSNTTVNVVFILHCQSPIFADCSPNKFNILGCSACCRPSRTWITFNRFSTIFEAFVTHFYLCCTHCIVPKILLNHPNSFCGGMFKLTAKLGCRCVALLSHFECDGHTVHMLPQQYLPSPLTIQWSGLCSCLHIPVYSPWLPGYIDVTWTVVILTMAGLFPDRPCILQFYVCLKYFWKKIFDAARMSWRSRCL